MLAPHVVTWIRVAHWQSLAATRSTSCVGDKK